MKRRTFKLLLFMLAGAIVNVGVAWVCAAWSRASVSSLDRFYQREIPYWGVSKADVEYYRALGWQSDEGELHYELDAMAICGFGLIERTIDDAVQAHPDDQRYSLGTIRRNSRPHALEVMSGWPRISFKGAILQSSRRGNAPLGTKRVTAIALPAKWQISMQGHQRYLPYGIVWPGFAINTMFFALVMWMIVTLSSSSLGVMRRRVRIKRGQCASCGYSLRESVSDKCPECGALTGD